MLQLEVSFTPRDASDVRASLEQNDLSQIGIAGSVIAELAIPIWFKSTAPASAMFQDTAMPGAASNVSTAIDEASTVRFRPSRLAR